jgi:hypothetical protein
LILLDVSKAVQEIIPVPIIKGYSLPFNSSYDDVLQSSRSLPARALAAYYLKALLSLRSTIRVLATKRLSHGRRVARLRRGGRASMRAFLGMKENCLFN